MKLLLAALAAALAAPARAASCYANASPQPARSLGENRDRLIADLARRKARSSCALWASLNKAERFIFLMDTAYLADPSSRLFPPSAAATETALDRATALYSINGPDGSGRGGIDYNRIYLGFDALAACVMRDPQAANPAHEPAWNQWVSSDDSSGPHPPFNQREMIFWEAWARSSNSIGPQFHHFHSDGDFDRAGVDRRLGVCGVSDPTLTELTIAFDWVHNSDPLGDYTGRGGYGWQIVDQHLKIAAGWDYTPGGCEPSPPLNDDPFGGTFNGMGLVQDGAGACAPAVPAGTAAGAARTKPAAPTPGPALGQLSAWDAGGPAGADGSADADGPAGAPSGPR